MLYALALGLSFDSAGGVVKSGVWVEGLNFNLDLYIPVAGGEVGGWYLVHNHLDHLELLSAAGGRWDSCADGFLKFSP